MGSSGRKGALLTALFHFGQAAQKQTAHAVRAATISRSGPLRRYRS